MEGTGRAAGHPWFSAPRGVGRRTKLSERSVSHRRRLHPRALSRCRRSTACVRSSPRGASTAGRSLSASAASPTRRSPSPERRWRLLSGWRTHGAQPPQETFVSSSGWPRTRTSCKRCSAGPTSSSTPREQLLPASSRRRRSCARRSGSGGRLTSSRRSGKGALSPRARRRRARGLARAWPCARVPLRARARAHLRRHALPMLTYSLSASFAGRSPPGTARAAERDRGGGARVAEDGQGVSRIF
jgi:hypothetical protein